MTSIDILVPVYNRSDLLPQLLESCLAQTFPAREIILVDDASTDPLVGPILENFAARFPNIRVLTHDENRGICNTQETGLKASTADFIAFVDCDDYLSPVALESTLSAITDDVDYVFTDRFEVDEDGNSRLVRYGGQPDLIGNGEVRDHLLDHMVASHLKVIRRSKLNEVGGFSTSLDGVQDWDIALRISESGTFSYVPKGLYFHRVHSAQVTRTQSTRMIRDTNSVRRNALLRRNNVLQTIPRFFPDRDNPGLLSRVLQLVKSGIEFDAALGVTHTGAPIFVPMLTNGQVSADVVNSVQFLLIHHKVRYEAADLKPFLLGPNPATIGFIASAEITSDASYRFRWLNSYFDYVLSLDDLGELALRGYTHSDLRFIGSKSFGLVLK